jgi:hypothetical protein
MSLVVRAFPVLKEKEFREFVKEVSGARSAEAADFYRRHGVKRETVHWQETPAGPWAIVVTEIADVEPAARQYAASELSYDRWFKDRIQQLTGINPDRDPLGPPTEAIFEWPSS